MSDRFAWSTPGCLQMPSLRGAQQFFHPFLNGLGFTLRTSSTASTRRVPARTWLDRLLNSGPRGCRLLGAASPRRLQAWFSALVEAEPLGYPTAWRTTRSERLVSAAFCRIRPSGRERAALH